MQRDIRGILSFAMSGLVLGGPLLGVAQAVDGTKLISQNNALAGNVTPGDAPGFPVTISQPGSYVLSSNLTVPDAFTTAIEIAADHVTVDLNGFAILGPVDCSGGFPCAGEPPPIERGGDGVGSLLDNPRFNITVRNGTVQGMGASGVSLYGDSNVVEHVNARSNGGLGIILRRSIDSGASTVRHAMAQRNGGVGIYVDVGLVSHSTASVNENAGIFVGQGTASYNFSNRNGIEGLLLGESVGYFGNNLLGNGLRPVSGGKNHGQNLCNGVTCVGAQF
jgi:hypothetical protein